MLLKGRQCLKPFFNICDKTLGALEVRRLSDDVDATAISLPLPARTFAIVAGPRFLSAGWGRNSKRQTSASASARGRNRPWGVALTNNQRANEMNAVADDAIDAAPSAAALTRLEQSQVTTSCTREAPTPPLSRVRALLARPVCQLGVRFDE